MSLTVINQDKDFHDSLKDYIQYIEEELNTPTIIHEVNVATYVDLKAIPNHKTLGQKLGKEYNKDLKAAAGNLSAKDIETLKTTGSIELVGKTLVLEDFTITQNYKKEFSSGELELGGEGEIILLLDLSQDEKLRNKGLVREFTSAI